MPVIIKEGKKRFEFGDSWKVQKYDDTAYYRKRLQKLPETKAVDIVCVSTKNEIYLIEIKDYRKESLHKSKYEKKTIEVSQKVRDTVAGIIGAFHMAEDPIYRDVFWPALGNRHKKPYVLFWLEEKYPNTQDKKKRHKQKKDVIQKKLSQMMRWLTTNVKLIDRENYSNYLTDCHVVDLSRSPEI